MLRARVTSYSMVHAGTGKRSAYEHHSKPSTNKTLKLAALRCRRIQNCGNLVLGDDEMYIKPALPRIATANHHFSM